MNEKYKKQSHNSLKMLLVDAAVLVLTLILDQLVKHRIRLTLPERSFFDVIPGVLQIYHHENGGSAFGMLQGQTIFFIFIAILVLFVVSYVLYTIPSEKKYIAMNVALTLVLSGAVGNTIDRVMKSTVTDFIYVSLINFPIFNIADMYIVIATFLILFLVLFVYKEEDLKFIDLGKTQDTRPVKKDE